MKLSKWKWISLGIFMLVVSVYAIGGILLRATPDEIRFREELESLPAQGSVKLSTFSDFKEYDTICIIDSYAIDPSLETKRLSQIFGAIDYSRFRREITERYSGDYGIGLFPVKGNQVVTWIRVGASPRAYIHPGKIKQTPPFTYFKMSSCYRPSDVCLTRTVKDRYGYQIVEMNFCQPRAEELMK